ncbi:Tyrosine-protein phosphatase YwqE [bacterium HR37]|nr:Tyrosine-protein phosphatase YwqE [bacterium HR37]
MGKDLVGDCRVVDIHCHLLPDMDDGARSWEESLKMARIASESGINTVVATPHWIQGTVWEPNPDVVRKKVSELNELLCKNCIPLSVFPGMEIGISENVVELVSSGRVLTLAEGRYVLVEVPFFSLPVGIEEVVYRLVDRGFFPILAHPERSRDIQKNPKRICDLVDNGALIQITAGSLCGCFGGKAKKCALELIELDAVHIVASDAHSSDKRPPLLSKAMDIVKRIKGIEYTNRLLLNASRCLG